MSPNTASTSKPSDQLSPGFIRMIRDDFVNLLRHENVRAFRPYDSERRLARDLNDLNGMAGEW